jgi:hypothetical protein
VHIEQDELLLERRCQTTMFGNMCIHIFVVSNVENFDVQVLENILHEVWGENFMGMKQTINAKMEAN